MRKENGDLKADITKVIVDPSSKVRRATLTLRDNIHTSYKLINMVIDMVADNNKRKHDRNTRGSAHKTMREVDE